MAEWFASGRIIDFILVLMALEAVLFPAWPGLVGKNRQSRFDPLANLASGAALMLALRSALTGQSWPWTAVFLGVSFASHLADILQRHR